MSAAIGWGIYLGTAAFSVVGFALGWMTGRGSKAIRLAASAAALGLILLKALLHAKPAWEANLFPWDGYVYLQSYWLYPLGMFFLGLAITQLSVPWNRAVIAGFALGFFAYSLQSESWMIFPPDDSSTQAADDNHHCRQTTSYTCVPASCVTLLSYWGIKSTEGEMARLCRTRGDGTTTFNAFVGIRHKLKGTELRARVLDMDWSTFQALQTPVLFCDRTPHAVVMVYTNRTSAAQRSAGQFRPVRASRRSDQSDSRCRHYHPRQQGGPVGNRRSSRPCSLSWSAGLYPARWWRGVPQRIRGFHPVPNFSRDVRDGVESVPTRWCPAWSASWQRDAAGTRWLRPVA